MKQKMIELGKKTGMEAKEAAGLAKIGLSGFLALFLSAFTAGTGIANDAKENPRPGNTAAHPLSDKCWRTPVESGSREPVTTYYYDPQTNTCMEAKGKVSPIFDSRNECNRTCIRIPTGTKYGGVGIYDFRDE